MENPDLKKERSTCMFDKEEITNLIDGDPEKTKERRDLGIDNQMVLYSFRKLLKVKLILEEFILSDDELKDSIPIEYLSHTEKYSADLRKACLLFKKFMDPSTAG